MQLIFIETELLTIFCRTYSHMLKSFMIEGNINAALDFENLTLPAL